MKSKLLLAVTLVAASVLAPLSFGKAASLELDQAFRAPLFAQPGPTSRTVLLPDGKFLKFFNTDTLTDQRTGALTRYLPDATLDTSFSFSRDYRSVSAATAAADGKIIIAATRYVYGDGILTEEILRLNADGSIDSSFSITLVEVGPDAVSSVRHIVLQPDGKILVAGYFQTFSGLPRQAIVRLLPDGTLDSSFTPPAFEEYGGVWSDPVVLPSSQILIAGTFRRVNGAPTLQVARLNSDGSVDGTFQPTGFNATGTPIRGLVVQSDGKIVLAGRFQFGSGISATRAPLFRLNSDGSADDTFTLLTNLITGFPSSTDLLMQPDGRLVAAINFSIYRFNADGSADGTFAPPALRDTTFYAAGGSGRAFTLNLEPDGKILVGGIFTDVNPPDGLTGSHFGVVRLNSDGSVDPALVTSHRTGIEKFPGSFARLPDGSTLVAFDVASVRMDPPMPFNVGRLLPDGTLDTKFSLSSSDPGSVLNQEFLATDFIRSAAGSFFANGLTADFIATGARFLPNGMEDPSFAWDTATPTHKGSVARPRATCSFSRRQTTNPRWKIPSPACGMAERSIRIFNCQPRSAPSRSSESQARIIRRGWQPAAVFWQCNRMERSSSSIWPSAIKTSILFAFSRTVLWTIRLLPAF